MRIFLFILGVFAAVVCFEKPAAADGPWCVVWAQSCVPRRVGARSIWAREAPL